MFRVEPLSLLWGSSCYVLQGRLCVGEPRSRRIVPPVRVDLDLTSPGCSRPVALDDDANEAPEAAPDLSVTVPSSPEGVPAPESALSSDRESFRQQLFSALQSAFAASAASGTIRTYESTLRAIVPKVALKLGTQVLPMISDCQFCSFFGSAVLPGP